jgi:CMP-2-keto-3-deoxyoctulosonic acid synthetase
MSIGVRLVETVPFGVDTPEDLERARRILEGGA